MLEFDLPHFSILEIAGKDASTLLQAQITRNLTKLAPKNAYITAICNTKGRVLSLFYLIKNTDNFWLILPQELLSVTIDALKKYAVFYKVTLHDMGNQLDLKGIYANSHQTQDPNHYPINETLSFKVMHKIASPSRSETKTLAFSAFHKLLIEQHYPTLGLDGSLKWLPQELGLLDFEAIDFDKGCYIGQEIIARVHYRSNKLFTIKTLEIESEHNPIYLDLLNELQQVAGTIIDAVLIQPNHYLILSLMKDFDGKSPLFLSSHPEYYIKVLSYHD